MKLIFLFMFFSLTAFSQKNQPLKWGIEINLYREYPAIESFEALKDLAIIAVEELGNGYLLGYESYRRAYRRDFNGATFCLTINSGLLDAEEQLKRITKRVEELKPSGQFVHYYVVKNSDCNETQVSL